MNKGFANYQSDQKFGGLSILQRIAKTDKSAVADCIDTYGGLVWTTAKNYTRSTNESEKIVEEIFKDIWSLASNYNPADEAEEKYILRIIFRYLIKHQVSNTKTFSRAEPISPLYLKNKGIHKKLVQI